LQIRVAAIGDLHAPRGRPGELQSRLQKIEGHADVLLLCGDLTDTGDPHEARALLFELSDVKIPMVAVLGNHDHDRGQADRIRACMEEARVRVLDGESCVVAGLGIAGTKGFGGGFGRRRVGSFGEPAIKHFVREGEREAEKLENALRSLDTPHRIALTHYAPVLGTVIGEAPEIVAFLGNSDLALAAERAGALAMFHGHSHFGRPQARTERGIPVFNCALPVLDAQRPPRRFALHPVPLSGSAEFVAT
jgi:Icc-related predicted phosphoesterase